MSEQIQLGTNVLFYPKSEYTTGKALKLVVSKVAAICTRRHIYLVPVQEIAIGLVRDSVANHQPVDGGTVEENLNRLLETPGLTLDALHDAMTSMLGSDDHRVIDLGALKSYGVKGPGFLAQLRMKHPASVAPRVLVARGKGAMKELRGFYN